MGVGVLLVGSQWWGLVGVRRWVRVLRENKGERDRAGDVEKGNGGLEKGMRVEEREIDFRDEGKGVVIGRPAPPLIM